MIARVNKKHGFTCFGQSAAKHVLAILYHTTVEQLIGWRHGVKTGRSSVQTFYAPINAERHVMHLLQTPVYGLNHFFPSQILINNTALRVNQEDGRNPMHIISLRHVAIETFQV